MYYHVRVEYFEKNKKISKYEYMFDLNTTDKIVKDILKPFKLDKQIIINGRFLTRTDVSKIQVVKTENDTENLIDDAYASLSPGIVCIYNKQDVAFSSDNCLDITTELLDSISEKKNNLQTNNISSHLNEQIANVSLQKYLDGYYADAVESAIKEINSRLKKMYKKFKHEELDGSDLFAKVFLDDETKTLLKVSDLSSQSGKDEQKGYRLMFMGMWSAMRNPKAHENLTMTEDEAYDRLIFLSMLMKKIDKAFRYTFEE